ncbi:hypothetical protein [Dickeya dianthicola]|uniref:hypothetical protein n=1 Tax=Dickeya dianthicola TaxID=204039 RepID=UPI001F6020A3|nr:hypothetical protein [Dickeya dianthicola]MCI4239369.1 hypothetical protein [Dickeya dianthicola]MCI4256281.1 hypothetical protein [Dickeya dianthicola]
MKELFSLVGAVVIWVFVARYLSRMFIKKGHKPWLSKTSGVCVGSVVALAFLVAVVPTASQNASTQNITAETKPASKPHDGCLEVYKPDGPSEWNCEKKEVPAPAPAEQAETESTQKPEKYFDITPQEFAKRMNANLAKFESPFKLKVVIKSGSVNDTFNYMFNDRLAIVGTVSKSNGKLAGVILMLSGDGTTESGLHVFAIATSAYSALLGKNELGTGVPANLVLDLFKKESGDAAKILNNIKFTLVKSEQIGNMFTADPL